MFLTIFKVIIGSMGPFEANIKLGPVQITQRKGRVPQYAFRVATKIDDLESQ